MSIAIASLRPSSIDPLVSVQARAARTVVLLGDGDIEPLPSARELPRVEIGALGSGEEELGVATARVIRLLGCVKPLERVLADRVEHAGEAWRSIAGGIVPDVMPT